MNGKLHSDGRCRHAVYGQTRIGLNGIGLAATSPRRSSPGTAARGYRLPGGRADQPELAGEEGLLHARQGRRAKRLRAIDNDGTEVDPEVLDYIREQDKKFEILRNCVEFIDLGRTFGIRVAMFMVDSPETDYYTKPFNPDGVRPNSYKGISQIDPYWITPELGGDAAANPSAPDFYDRPGGGSTASASIGRTWSSSATATCRTS